MKFETYWLRFIKKNPKAKNNDHLIVKAENFRRSMAQSYEQGYRDGHAAGYAKADNEKSFFERIFG